MFAFDKLKFYTDISLLISKACKNIVFRGKKVKAIFVQALNHIFEVKGSRYMLHMLLGGVHYYSVSLSRADLT